MSTTELNLRKRLLYILHRAFVESRLLATAGSTQQIFDLADAMEILPRYVEGCNEEDLELIRSVLTGYQQKYPASRFNYLAHLEKDPPECY